MVAYRNLIRAAARNARTASLSGGAPAVGPKQFREFAQECVRSAEYTADERQRQVLFDLAKQWMQAALAVEGSIALIDDYTPLVP
jgi:hypothetical protein